MKKSRFFLILASLVTAAGARDAHAFPELIRHGYANCVTCHASPGGGGVLNAYGRELSREALTTWGTEAESGLAWGLIQPPEWLSSTLMARSLSLVRDSKTTIDGRTLLMQLDAEAAAASDHFTVAAAAGLQDPNKGDILALRRAYGVYRPTDELSFRVGKFAHVYGLMQAEHKSTTRTGLGWDEGNETLNAEAAWIGESTNLFATALFGRPDNHALERGASLSGSLFLDNRFKVGLNAYAGQRPSDDSSRVVFGPHAALGFTPTLYWLGEIDLQNRAETWGTYQYQKLSYEAFKGVHIYITQDLQKNDWSNGDSLSWSWGPGVQWFPRPHFEGQLYVTWQNYPEALQELNTATVYAMLNFYL
jgi:hypothetical protein